MNLFIQITIVLSFLILAVYAHETGHKIKAEKLGYKAVMRWEKNYKKLLPDLVTEWYGKKHTDEDTNQIIKAGVVLGTVPLITLFFAIDIIHSFLIIWVWAAYLWLSKDDIKRIMNYDDLQDEA